MNIERREKLLHNFCLDVGYYGLSSGWKQRHCLYQNCRDFWRVSKSRYAFRLIVAGWVNLKHTPLGILGFLHFGRQKCRLLVGISFFIYDIYIEIRDECITFLSLIWREAMLVLLCLVDGDHGERLCVFKTMCV